MTDELTVGSLCSGIGGIDLGLERAGMRVIWQSEIDPYANKVLAKHWPDVPNLGDMKTIDWNNVERPDLICGGYPCQPFSLAGKRLGEDDPRHLWPYVADAIRALRPKWALLENVRGHLSKGFGTVLGELAEIGYDAEWDCIPASSVGAHHQRDRVIIVAYPDTDGERFTRGQEQDGGPVGSGVEAPRRDDLGGFRDDVADTDPIGRDGGPRLGGKTGWPELADGRQRAVSDTDGERFQEQRDGIDPTAQHAGPECGGGWAIEPDVGRVAHGVPHRVDRLRGLGNAVVPQVAEHVGRLIVEAANRG